MVARWLALLALLVAAPAAADTLEGSWALQAEGATIFRFDLSKGDDGKWRGTWSKPTAFASNGDSFSRLKGPAKQVSSRTAIEIPDGIELSFDDPTPGAVPDIFDFKPIDEDAVQMIYVGTDLAPYTLTRVKPGAPLGPWEAGKTYSREVPGGAQASAEPPKIAPEDVLGDFLSDEQQPAPAKPATDQLPLPPAGGFRLKPGAPVGR